MKKIIMVALLVVLFVSTVGVGVHVMHRDAASLSFYIVECFAWDGDPVAVEGVMIKIAIDGELPRYIETNEFGFAVTTTDDPEAWTAQIVDNEWDYAGGDQHPANCSQPMTVTWGVVED